jgi:hypothetical protein
MQDFSINCFSKNQNNFDNLKLCFEQKKRIEIIAKREIHCFTPSAEIKNCKRGF